MDVVTCQTPVGTFRLLCDAAGTVRAAGFAEISDLLEKLPIEYRREPVQEIKHHPYQAAVAAYFDGDARALGDIPYAQTGTPFQEAVWQAIAGVPFGQTISYRELAARAGRPAAVRAAGSACGRNRITLLIPCHRITTSSGKPGNYAYGSDRKQQLLNREQSA